MSPALLSKTLARFLLAAIVLCYSPIAVSASESFATVKLFYAHAGYKQLRVIGPCVLKFGNTEERLTAGDYKISVESDTFLISGKSQSVSARRIKASSIIIVPSANSICLGVSDKTMRRYKGTMLITREAGALVCYNRVDIRDYVNSVVGSETLPETPMEALKAQSVIVQTAMLRYKNGDQLNDSTEKQAYFGVDYVRPSAKRAVDDTWGETLRYKGKVPTLYFHSCCAGGTTSSAFFTGKMPAGDYDKAVACKYCTASPFWKASKASFARAEFIRAMGKELPSISETDANGRPTMVQYTDGKEERAYEFWLRLGQKLGWDKAPGTRFELMQTPRTIIISSRGAGHGVGLCQWGAIGMAKEKASYKEILAFYFPGTRVERH